MNNYHILVFDVGKTNKKILVYDSNLNIKESEYKSFDEYREKDINVENISEASQWFIDKIKKYSSTYNIKVISITTHGASFVTVDESGNIALPVVAYTTEPGENFHREFYDKFGSPEELQKYTATPNFSNLINIAKGIYFLQKRFKDEFNKVKKILFLPQYYAFMLTGNVCVEPTYLGCHTYLWDFINNRWSDVAERLGVVDKLPQKVNKPWDICGRVKKEIADITGVGEDTIVTSGIHDSNSSLLPYLIKMGNEEFILNSTGTWCVAMKPTDRVEFADDELGKTVFYNISAFNKPVKTTIFLGGLEFDTYTKILKKINNRIGFPEFNPEIYQKIINESDLFILPGVVKGTGQFPDSLPRVVEDSKIFQLEDIKDNKLIPHFFYDYDKAYAVLNISLAIQTKIALDRAGVKDGMPIFVEGGFRKNDAYNYLLTSLYPESKISLTNLEEATAFGAVILGKCAVEKVEPNSVKDLFEIEFKYVNHMEFKNFNKYIKKYLKIMIGDLR